MFRAHSQIKSNQIKSNFIISNVRNKKKQNNDYTGTYLGVCVYLWRIVKILHVLLRNMKVKERNAKMKLFHIVFFILFYFWAFGYCYKVINKTFNKQIVKQASQSFFFKKGGGAGEMKYKFNIVPRQNKHPWYNSTS
jgi:hypothetical protein